LAHTIHMLYCKTLDQLYQSAEDTETYLSSWNSRVLLKNLIVTQARNSPPSMEPKGLLSYSQ